MRVGIGYDIHRIEPGLPLVLGGVSIPSEFGLAGHSDADVILHALMDALLGASALGDIGQHFPPGDDRFRGISSLLLLHSVRELLDKHRFAVVNVDIMVVAEEPRLSPYVEQMRSCIAGALELNIDAVSVKATSNELVGPEGRLEAISAQSIAVVKKAE